GDAEAGAGIQRHRGEGAAVQPRLQRRHAREIVSQGAGRRQAAAVGRGAERGGGGPPRRGKVEADAGGEGGDGVGGGFVLPQGGVAQVRQGDLDGLARLDLVVRQDGQRDGLDRLAGGERQRTGRQAVVDARGGGAAGDRVVDRHGPPRQGRQGHLDGG